MHRFSLFAALTLTLVPLLTHGQDGLDGANDGGMHGGVIVQLGCGDGSGLLDLAADEHALVQALDTDPAKVAAARARIQAAGCYGRVSADTYDGFQLPYADNMVNRIVVHDPAAVSPEEMLRVLCPNGTAVRLTPDTRNLTPNLLASKPWPAEIDEWPHYLHGPDNNAVAKDTVVGPPRRLQWQAEPKWTRHHDHMSSLSALVSSGGRLFYIIDEGSSASIYLPSHWSLIARDAFNGKLLWKQPIEQWYNRFKGLKDGPADAPRRLIAAGDRVFAMLSLHGPVTALDAATGDVVREYAGTEEAEELLLSEGVLFVLTGTGSLGDGARTERPVEPRTILALDVESGEPIWRSEDVVAAMTLAVDGNGVYYLNFDKQQIVGLNRETGQRLWASASVPVPARQTSFFASKLVVHDGVVLLASGEYSGLAKSGGGEVRDDTLTAVDAATGQTLWTAKHSPSGYSSPEDLYVIDGMVWFSAAANGRFDGMVTALDLKTGQVKRQFSADESSYWFHHRCYSGRATSNYMLTSRTGIEFIDLETEHWDLNHWVRGACLYGIMPANGLVYAPPSPCICYAESMLHSFNAFAPTAASKGGREEELKGERVEEWKGDRLQRGPAYADARLQTQDAGPLASSWPTYRGDAARSGSTAADIPTELRQTWATEIGGKLSATVIAAGRLYVSAVDQHTVYALDAATGQSLWQFTTGGRVDSPPTIADGRVLFGSADGSVYCLRADDGELIWRFLAAPLDRRIVSYEQLESVWPVHGSVLVRDGSVYLVAGRSLFVDGGMRLYRLDAKSGEIISETTLDDHNPATGKDVQELIKWLNMAVGRPDILSCDGQRIYMRSQAFDLKGNRLAMGPKTGGSQEGQMQDGENTHLFCPTGFLDDTWFHRTYWMYGQTWGSGWCGYFVNGKYAPAGKMIAVGDDAVYVFGRQPQYYRWTTPMEYRLFAAKKQWQPPARTAVPEPKPAAKKKSSAGSGPGPVDNPSNYYWVTEVPVLVRAMALAGDTLLVAGPRDVLDERTASRVANDPADDILRQEAALAGTDGAVLWAVSAKDGSKLAEYELDAPPVFDGLSVAGGRVYLSTTDGVVRSFGQ